MRSLRAVGYVVVMTASRPRARTDVVTARLSALIADMEEATKAVVVGQPGGIHDLRVAIRRARSCLRTFRPLFDRERSEALRGELKWMAAALGSARDPEVLARRLERRLDGLEVEERLGPVRRELVGGRRSAADRGRADVVDAFGTERYRRMLAHLDAFAAHPPYRRGRTGRDTAALLRCTRKELRRYRSLSLRARAVPAGTPRDAAFHEVRKAAKRVRYAAETVVPLAPKPARRLAARYERVQELLGERQDAAVARRFLVGEGARVGVRPTHNGFTYGLLAEKERAAIAAAEQKWDRVWRKASRKEVGGFLAG